MRFRRKVRWGLKLAVLFTALLIAGLVLMSCGGGGGGGGGTVAPPTSVDYRYGSDYLSYCVNGGGWPSSAAELYPPVGGKWTVMIYLNADNDLAVYAFDDLNEILDAGGADNGVNIIVLLDRPNNEPTTLHFLRRGEQPVCWVIGELDMSDPNVLRQFVSWSMKNYPASRYMLVLWDHGDGWRSSRQVKDPLKEVSCDETTGFDSCMSIPEVRQALAGLKVDILGFDACLMGTLEVVYNLREFADYIVASEKTIDADGWDYSFIGELISNPDMTPESLGKIILSYYHTYYSGTEHTLALIDTSKLGPATTVISTLNDLALQLSSETPTAISNTFDQVSGMLGGWYSLRDYRQLLEVIRDSSSLSVATKNAAYEALQALNTSGLIVDFVSDDTTLGGLSIYAPTLTESYDTTYGDETLYPFANDTSWDDMLDTYHY